MPRISVSVPHQEAIPSAAEKSRPALEKTVQDFQGRDLDIQWHDANADFSFKSMAFTIQGTVAVDDSQITVSVDLPFAAMIYKDKVEKAIRKNLTCAIAGE